MLTRIYKPRDDREAGFTLIELLVVVAIIGILAAIAIPVFLNQRASARDASVKADINGIAKVMETVYTDKGYYPTASTTQTFTQAMTANNGIFFNATTIAVDTTVASNYNGVSAGPVTVNSGITVTVASGSVWTVV